MIPKITLSDIVQHVRANSNSAEVASMLNFADTVLAKDGGRNCERVLTMDELAAFGFSFSEE